MFIFIYIHYKKGKITFLFNLNVLDLANAFDYEENDGDEIDR